MRVIPLFFNLFAATWASSFSYTNTTFLLNGEPYRILGGQMDPQRIPYQLWRDRLSKARAMGLNTIFSYVFWDQVEPTQGEWNWQGNNDIAQYFEIAQEEGLNIVLRPGPYVCGEHEWGGFPAWLSMVSGMTVRTDNGPFLAASQSYIDHLGQQLEAHLVTNGGPILMVQIENEYGSYGSDHTYIGALRDMIHEAFPGIPLYTTDGSAQYMLEGGPIPNALAETDGDPRAGFAARDRYVTNPSSLGPQLDGEYYITWLDQWGSTNSYSTYSGNNGSIQAIQNDLEWILNNNGSFSIYMFHGGTNWGFQNGADWGSALEPVITSYDYGAPLDESGRTNDIYAALRKTLSSWLGSKDLPNTVSEDPLVEIPSFPVHPTTALFDFLGKPTEKPYPVNMEALGQAYGFTLYRHVSTSSISGTVQPGDAPRDRVLVYVNEKRVGVIDSIYQTPNTVNVTLQPHDVLDLLVENMGRVNYGPRIPDQRKGIVGNVTVGGNVLTDWEMYPLPLDELSLYENQGRRLPQPTENASPVFYTGTFDVPTVGDTFLSLPGWVKGVVWVNGVKLGRYWTIGPQQTLYLPGCYQQKGANQVTVLELEPTGDEGNLSGLTTRNWGNHPDPDAPA